MAKQKTTKRTITEPVEQKIKRLNELYVGGVKVMQNGRLTAEPLAQKAEAFINGLFAEKTNA